LKSGIKGWIDAGVPAEKINAGLAYYGRAIESTERMENSQYATSKKGAPKGDSDDAYWQDPFCQLDQGGFSGIWKWKNLRSEGIIGKDGNAGNGYTKHWDSISQTPWLYNENSKTFISYEDPESIKRKVDSALCLGIGGVMAW
jgi:GH18 family chitinase